MMRRMDALASRAVLEVYDSNKHYESYQIHLGDRGDRGLTRTSRTSGNAADSATVGSSRVATRPVDAIY